MGFYAKLRTAPPEACQNDAIRLISDPYQTRT